MYQEEQAGDKRIIIIEGVLLISVTSNVPGEGQFYPIGDLSKILHSL
jgi:hypothetical protein